MFNSTRRFRVPRATAPAAMDEHQAIKKIGRVLTVSIVVLLLACVVMLASGTLVRLIYDRDTAAAEQVRAANAIDLVVGLTGSLTQTDAALIGRVAGLKNARLSATAPTEGTAKMIPLLGEQTTSGGYLVWEKDTFSGEMFRLFAPVRLPMIAAILLIVVGLMFYVRRQVGDIERQRLTAHRQSRTDVVTGLSNRLAFEDAIGELAAGSAPFALVIFDLDRFKTVNDVLGHAAGDAVLRCVARRLAELLGPGDQLARLGGDEFVMLRVSDPGTVALSAFARACIASIEQPIELAERVVQVGISMGIVAAGGGNLPPSTLLGAADAALYRAKSVPGSSHEFAGDTPADPANWQLRSA
ncbi:MAG: diguanylate cyclase domain-containing protein [Devosia sp.]